MISKAIMVSTHWLQGFEAPQLNLAAASESIIEVAAYDVICQCILISFSIGILYHFLKQSDFNFARTCSTLKINVHISLIFGAFYSVSMSYSHDIV